MKTKSTSDANFVLIGCSTQELALEDAIEDIGLACRLGYYVHLPNVDIGCLESGFLGVN